MPGLEGASQNSLRSLRSLRSNSRDEHVNEARQGAPPSSPVIPGATEIAAAGYPLPRWFSIGGVPCINNHQGHRIRTAGRSAQ